MHFIYYHMRRTTVMTVLHCFLPLLYCIGLHWSEPSLSVVSCMTTQFAPLDTDSPQRSHVCIQHFSILISVIL